MRKKNTLLILFLLLMLTTLGCQKEEDFSKYTFDYEFVTGNQYFSFEYPNDWEIEENKVSDGEGLPEDMPDFGVHIYMDSNKNNSIYIFEGISLNMYKDETFSKSDFMVDGVKRGDLCSLEYEDEIYKLITFNHNDENHVYRYAFVKAEREFYNKNETRIVRILESIDF